MHRTGPCHFIRHAAATLVVSAAAALHAACASASTITQWSPAIGGNAHRYEAVSANGITWSEAKAAAEARGGHLATVTSAAENAFIASLVPDYGTAEFPFWLGGFQPSGSAPAAGWQWITGESWDYTNWAVGEPSIGGEHVLVFAYFAAGDSWNNAPDGFSGYGSIGGYVVEYAPPAAVPLPASLPLLALGLATIATMRRVKTSGSDSGCARDA
jgi:hypothetical protein